MITQPFCKALSESYKTTFFLSKLTINMVRKKINITQIKELKQKSNLKVLKKLNEQYVL